MTAPNLADLRAEVAELEGLDIGHFLIADVTALVDEVEALREQVLAGRQAAEDAAALRKAIADVLAWADHFPHSGACHFPDEPCNCRVFQVREGVREAITPDAPASEAPAPNASAYRDTGRPLHSSSTEQED